MPEGEQDQQEAVDPPETVPGAPDWGGVTRTGGDNADATGGPPTDTDVGGDLTDADAGEDAGADADAAGDADAGDDATTGSPE